MVYPALEAQGQAAQTSILFAEFGHVTLNHAVARIREFLFGCIEPFWNDDVIVAP